jgi:uncharacterized protein (DUF433 family)/DNA-binding transcriptional MerR regulator
VDRIKRAFDGSYPAPRAAALSGVPVSTVYHWARTELLVPSVSKEKEKLWSYADLMALRIIDWLRHPKQGSGLEQFAASSMREVREALSYLDELDIDIWSDSNFEPCPLRVTPGGKIFVYFEEGAADIHGQRPIEEFLDLLGPFTNQRRRGPDLRRPRPHLRIIPGKCAGEPHLSGSRITTPTVAALWKRGYPEASIAKLYPDQATSHIREAIDLERELAGNLQPAA